MTEYKVVVVGPGGVGKSALVTQLMQNQFSEDYDPTIEDTYRKQLTVDNRVSLLDILDTAGQEEYNTMRDQYMRHGDGFILVFGFDNPSTFKEVTKFTEQIRVTKHDPDVPILLVGNKCDLAKKVDVREIENTKKSLNIPFIETSARNRTNVDETFFEIVRMIRKKSDKNTKQKKKSKKGCILL